MNRVYGEPVKVQARPDGRPVRFVWRSRLYAVRAILEHGVINREWGRDPAAEPGQLELEFWRVQATPGRDGSRLIRGGNGRPFGKMIFKDTERAAVLCLGHLGLRNLRQPFSRAAP